MFQIISSLISSTTRTIRQTFDGFANVVTGLGTRRDKTTQIHVIRSTPLSYMELDTLIRDNKMAKKICLKPAEELSKKPVTVEIEEDEELEKEFNSYLKSFHDNIKLAYFWERGFGGAAILLDIKDGSDLSEPVNWDNISGFGTRILVFDKSWIFPSDAYNIFKEPEMYYVNIQNEVTINIHKDRLLIFKGTAATIQEKIEHQGFSDSVLQATYPAIRNYTTAHDTCATILHDFSQTVYKIKGLNDDLDDDDGEDDVLDRILLMEKTRSLIRATVIDSEDDFQREVANVSGIKDFISIFINFLIAQTDMPHNILMGDKLEGGLGQSGKTQMEQWKDFIRSEFTRFLPHYEHLVKLFAAYKGVDIPKVIIPNLYELDEIEEATVEEKKSITFNNYTTGIKSLWETQVFSSDELNQLVVKNDSLFAKVGSKIASLLGTMKW